MKWSFRNPISVLYRHDYFGTPDIGTSFLRKWSFRSSFFLTNQAQGKRILDRLKFSLHIVLECEQLLISSIVKQAKLHIENGDIQGIIDPSLRGEYDIQSMWKIAEKALMCVQPHGNMRPSMSEVIKEIQDAISIERGAEAVREGNSDEISRHSVHSSLNLGPLDFAASDHYLSIDDSISRPTARQLLVHIGVHSFYFLFSVFFLLFGMDFLILAVDHVKKVKSYGVMKSCLICNE